MGSSFQGVDVIKAVHRTLPSTSGVYRMIGERGNVLYVGKAKNLKNRVITYTQPDRLPLRLQRMVAETVRMEIVTTHTESEALLLEANLIKNLEPRYNILLKDGKSFSYILLTNNHDFPLLTRHRGGRDKKGSYHGPFASDEAIRDTLSSLHHTFKLRSCTDNVFATRKRPCLQYHIKRCSAPCVGYVSKEDYAQAVAQATAVLNGKSSVVQEYLAGQMKQASDALDFEQAAILRDRLQSLSRIQSKQTINVTHLDNADIIGVHQEGGLTCLQLFLFRSGSNYGTHAFFPRHGEGATIDEVLEAFLMQFYNDAMPSPLILLNHNLLNKGVIEEALSTRAGRSITIKTPKVGPNLKLVQHACINAKDALRRRLAERTTQRGLLERLGVALGLASPPRRIEVYDNSHTQGTNAVGTMIVAGPEGWIKESYRKYTIDPLTVPASDDYAMMRHVLTRRFSRALKERETEPGLWPDLVIVDGGAGQLSAARDVFDALGVHDVALLGVAKGPNRHAGEERFFQEGRPPYHLPPGDSLLFFMQRLRDEAHRFAIGTHRAKRAKVMIQSALQDIPGVGAKRKKALLHHFGSVKYIEHAGKQDLLQVPGINDALAEKIYSYFHPIPLD